MKLNGVSSYRWWKSTTVWGAILLAASRIVVDRSPASIGENVGIVLAALGVRKAVAKNGVGR